MKKKSIDILEKYLKDGYYIVCQDGCFILFKEDGNGYVASNTLHEMIVNLVAVDGLIL